MRTFSYEIKDGIHDWTRSDHAGYWKKAERILATGFSPKAAINFMEIL